jgi:molybdopterin-binding protein
MKISARNILPGTVKTIKKGLVTTVVTLEIAPGVEVVSTITSESFAALKLKKGQPASAIIKESSVLIGVE